MNGYFDIDFSKKLENQSDRYFIYFKICSWNSQDQSHCLMYTMTAITKGLNFTIISSFLIYLTNFRLVSGFSTEKCNHDLLADQVSNLLTCYDDLVNKYVDMLVKDYKEQMERNDNVYDTAKACKILEKMIADEKPCLSPLYEKCFDVKISKITDELFKSATSFCGTGMDPQKVSKLQNEVQKKLNSLVPTDPQSYFLSMVKTDKNINNCQMDMMLLGDLMKNQDCASAIYQFASAYQTATMSVFQVRMSGKMPEDFYMCSTIDNTLNSCSVENRCYSQQEMNLMKDVLRNYYKTLMDIIVAIKRNFGTVEKMLELIRKTRINVGVGEQQVIPQQQLDMLASFSVNEDMETNINNMIDIIIHDYESRDCQGKVNSGPRLDAPGLLLVVIDILIYTLYF